MWKKIDGKLVHLTDNSRIRFKTYINKNLLNDLKALAESENTHVSYLIENGLQNIVQDNGFVFNKSDRLKGKVEFRTTCDEVILQEAKEFADRHKLNFTDIVQVSVDYIDFNTIKKANWRYRIE